MSSFSAHSRGAGGRISDGDASPGPAPDERLPRRRSPAPLPPRGCIGDDTVATIVPESELLLTIAWPRDGASAAMARCAHLARSTSVVKAGPTPAFVPAQVSGADRAGCVGESASALRRGNATTSTIATRAEAAVSSPSRHPACPPRQKDDPGTETADSARSGEPRCSCMTSPGSARCATRWSVSRSRSSRSGSIRATPRFPSGPSARRGPAGRTTLVRRMQRRLGSARPVDPCAGSVRCRAWGATLILQPVSYATKNHTTRLFVPVVSG
jgi:hypothetical protein